MVLPNGVAIYDVYLVVPWFVWDCLPLGRLLKILVPVARLEIPELGLVLACLTPGLLIAILPEDILRVGKSGPFRAIGGDITMAVPIRTDSLSKLETWFHLHVGVEHTAQNWPSWPFGNEQCVGMECSHTVVQTVPAASSSCKTKILPVAHELLLPISPRAPVLLSVSIALSPLGI